MLDEAGSSGVSKSGRVSPMVATAPSGQGVSLEGACSGPLVHSEAVSRAESTYKVVVKVERKCAGNRNVKIQKKIDVGHV